MSGVNKVILIGHLGSDPEVRYTASGVAVASFSIATSEQWKDKDTGEKREKTEWHRIVAWRRLGEICGEYLSKGRQVYVEGKLTTEKYTDKSGIDRYITKIIANEVQFLGSKGDSSPRSRENDYGGPRYPKEPGGDPYQDDDIPF